eukprot:TRINITY_DN24220_c0_g1_i1.p2 TRINITY_DN24220_c0_g1~~TRINITY_DN24220_c0_g1_i1.p2  ORF type:complete len:189 (+),score=26.99 TRINITY_DN24220_c0_g1_i1:50-568(+)
MAAIFAAVQAGQGPLRSAFFAPARIPCARVSLWSPCAIKGSSMRLRLAELVPVPSPATISVRRSSATSSPDGASTGQCTIEELQQRDEALAESRARFSRWEDTKLSLGKPFGRKVWVGNFRSKEGDRRVTKLMITDSAGKKWMTLTEGDVADIQEKLKFIKPEMIRYGKKLT